MNVALPPFEREAKKNPSERSVDENEASGADGIYSPRGSRSGTASFALSKDMWICACCAQRPKALPGDSRPPEIVIEHSKRRLFIFFVIS